MPDDKIILVELYKTTLEELHHQERLYTQLVTGLFIVIPIFIAAISFLLGKDFLIGSSYVNHLKWCIFSLFVILITFFWMAIFRIDRRFRVCLKVSQKIETKLKEIGNTYDLTTLLVRGELDKPSFDNSFGKVRLYVYVGISVIALILGWFALFIWVGFG